MTMSTLPHPHHQVSGRGGLESSNFHSPPTARGNGNGGVVGSGTITKEHYQWWPTGSSQSQIQLQQSPQASMSSSGNHSTFNPSMFFSPSQSSMSVAAAVASMLPSTSQRKSRRCRCPNCLAGIQPIQGKGLSNDFTFGAT